MKNKIYCDICKKFIDIYEDTATKKNDRWDLVCLHCDNWLGSMKDIIGWSIEE